MNIESALIGARNANALPMFTVYERPSDLPNVFVVRMHVTHRDPTKSGPTKDAWTYDTLELARTTLENLGLVQMARHPDDDPVIVETWI